MITRSKISGIITSSVLAVTIHHDNNNIFLFLQQDIKKSATQTNCESEIHLIALVSSLWEQ